MSFRICIYFTDFNLTNVFYIGHLNNLFWVFLLKFIEFNSFTTRFSQKETFLIEHIQYTETHTNGYWRKEEGRGLLVLCFDIKYDKEKTGDPLCIRWGGVISFGAPLSSPRVWLCWHQTFHQSLKKKKKTTWLTVILTLLLNVKANIVKLYTQTLFKIIYSYTKNTYMVNSTFSQFLKNIIVGIHSIPISSASSCLWVKQS